MTETGGRVLAWMVLRQIGDDREAWRRRGTAVGVCGAPEPGPFRIRIRAAADLEGHRFGMPAWEDPGKAETVAGMAGRG